VLKKEYPFKIKGIQTYNGTELDGHGHRYKKKA
jgi:hypothetical protein